MIGYVRPISKGVAVLVSLRKLSFRFARYRTYHT